MKIWALIGGDCEGASIDHLILPDGVDIKAEHNQYWEWYYNKYIPGEIKKVEYMSFVDWLKKLGAIEPSKDILEEFGDD